MAMCDQGRLGMDRGWIPAGSRREVLLQAQTEQVEINLLVSAAIDNEGECLTVARLAHQALSSDPPGGHKTGS